MKLLFLINLLILSIVCNSQTSTSFGTTNASKQHSVKLNLMPLTITMFSFEYEHLYSNDFSFGARVGFAPSRKTSDFTLWQEADLRDSQFNGFSFSPFVKWYTNGTGKGFYLSAYGKYSRFEYMYSRDIGNDILTSNMAVTSAGGGLQIGKQWIWDSGVTIDWTFIGLSYLNLTGEYSLRSTNNLVEDLLWDDILIPALIIADTNPEGGIFVNENTNALDAIGRYNTIGFRMGLSIGYSF